MSDRVSSCAMTRSRTITLAPAPASQSCCTWAPCTSWLNDVVLSTRSTGSSGRNACRKA